MKEKLKPLVDKYRRTNSKSNIVRVLSILYITNVIGTRKINSNAILVLFLLLNPQKSRKFALN